MLREPWTWLALYLVTMSLIGFAEMGLDKAKAKRGTRRISEKALFLPALLGGSVGSILGMRLFRHKTRHWYFRFGLPAILALQIALCVWAVWWFQGG